LIDGVVFLILMMALQFQEMYFKAFDIIIFPHQLPVQIYGLNFSKVFSLCMRKLNQWLAK
jgi:hypothetical protein